MATEEPVESAERAGGGLDVAARARWLLTIVFGVATVALLIGTWRAADSADSVQVFVDAQATATAGRDLQARLIALQRDMWRFEARPDTDTARRLRAAFNDASRALLAAEQRIIALQRHPSAAVDVGRWVNTAGDPLLSRATPLDAMRIALGRMPTTLRPVLGAPGDSDEATRSALFRGAHTAAQTLSADAAALSAHANAMVAERAAAAERAVNYISRDQLVLFLLVAFLLPLAVGLGSRWISAPLIELRTLAKRIEAGRVRRLEVVGEDDIAQLARALRSALRRLENNDERQRAKIFEMRRVLRALIQPLSDAVLVVGRGGKIDYANPSAASLLATEVHNLETGVVEEVLFSPAFSDALANAWQGDIVDDGMDMRIETADRYTDVHTTLRAVRDRSGEVSRVVVVMRR